MGKLDGDNKGGGDDGQTARGPLRLISNRDAELKAMSPAERFFEEEVFPLLREEAKNIANERSHGEDSILNPPLIPDDLRDDLIRLLHSRSVVRMSELKGEKGFKGMLSVSVSQSYEGWFAVVKAAEAPLLPDFLPPNESYFFPCKDFMSGSGVDSEVFVEVVEGIKNEHGEESKEYRDILRVVELIRGLLYGNRSGSERVDMARELRVLRIRIGKAAGEIIYDFLSYYGRGDGEEDIEKVVDPRLKIGDVNLRKLT